MFGWALTIMTNAITETAFIQSPIMMVVKLVVYALLPFTSIGARTWTDGFDTTWAWRFILIGFLLLQNLHGARFFLPRSLRSKVYDLYKKKVSPEGSAELGLTCNLCLNRLDDVELEFKDTNDSSSYDDYEIGEYYETPWGHRFHPHWLLKAIDEETICPSWGKDLPKNIYSDQN